MATSLAPVAPVRPPTTQPAPPAVPETLEHYFALQANDAIMKGADPGAVTARLGQYVQHLRANPDLAAQANDAIGKGADPAAVAARYAGIASQATPPKNFIERGLSQAADVAGQVFSRHFPDVVESAIAAPVRSLVTAMSPSVGAARPDPRLSKGGNASGAAIDLTPYDAEHGGVTPGQRALATTQIATDLAAPSLAGGTTRLLGGGFMARTAGNALATSAAGAVNEPSDPAAGAVTGVFLGEAGRAIHSTARGVGGAAIDFTGSRPMETTPVRIGPVTVGQVEGIADRAARLNRRVIGSAPGANALPATSAKPVTAIDVAGVPGMRAARALATASPAAESELRGALDPRADAAVDRVIQHGLDATGLGSRENGLQVVDDMIAQRAQHGDENYQPVFAKYNQPIADTRFQEVANTPTGQQVLKRAGVLAADRGETIGQIAPFDPEALPPAKRAMYQRLLDASDGDAGAAAKAMQALGEPTQTGLAQLAPTLKQAHYVKLAFDDLLNSAPEPGTGGLGPNRAAAIRALRNKWVSAMDDAAPAYGQARQQYADESELVRAAELGRNLWKLHPAEAEKAFNELPAAAQDVFRRTGFDALAERVENGPADVERGVAKPRDQRRMRLLFPDEQSFTEFKNGLAEEAQMHANTQGVFNGSNTANKLADVANMAGVTFPDVVRAAASGRWHYLAGRVAANVSRRFMTEGADAVAVERARQLTAGANGDVAARTAALQRLGFSGPATATLVGGTATASAPTPSPAPRGPQIIPESRRLNAPVYGTGEMQGQAMPIPQPIPQSRRLGAGPAPASRVSGEFQQGPAMPIRQPLPLSRRLMSGGPVPMPTAGGAPLGPAIPSPGQAFEDAVQQTLFRLYQKRPELAVSMTPADQARLADQVRARIRSGRQ